VIVKSIACEKPKPKPAVPGQITSHWVVSWRPQKLAKGGIGRIFWTWPLQALPPKVGLGG
jgi:hypothetical protein